MKIEEKRERFKRLASSRTNEILKKLKVLGNCSNRSAYEYSEADISKIYTALEKAIKESRSRFYYPSEKKGFKL